MEEVHDKLDAPVKVTGSKNGDVYRAHLVTPVYVTGMDLDEQSPHGKHKAIKWTRCGRDELLSDAYEQLGISPD